MGTRSYPRRCHCRPARRSRSLPARRTSARAPTARRLCATSSYMPPLLLCGGCIVVVHKYSNGGLRPELLVFVSVCITVADQIDERMARRDSQPEWKRIYWYFGLREP